MVHVLHSIYGRLRCLTLLLLRHAEVKTCEAELSVLTIAFTLCFFIETVIFAFLDTLCCCILKYKVLHSF